LAGNEEDDMRVRALLPHLPAIKTSMVANRWLTAVAPDSLWSLGGRHEIIDGLLASNPYNCILVIIEKFSKYSHFLPLCHPYTATKVAELFVDSVYRLHGMSPSFLSERRSNFHL
jgi:hypothetical protein